MTGQYPGAYRPDNLFPFLVISVIFRFRSFSAARLRYRDFSLPMNTFCGFSLLVMNKSGTQAAGTAAGRDIWISLSRPAGLTFIPVYAGHSFISPAPGEREDGITHDIVRFLAWPRKRGAQQRLISCRKKWDGKGIDIRSLCRGLARGMMHVQNDPSTGENKVVWLEEENG